MKTNQEIIRLKQLVEDSIPRKIKTPADFVYLSGVIFERCGETYAMFVVGKNGDLKVVEKVG